MTISRISGSETDFWKEIWSIGKLGFHQTKPNPHLIAQYNSIESKLGSPKNIFLPLCGKTLDLKWLSKQASHVYGVEVVETAILEFFSENNIPFEKENIAGVTAYKSDKITLYCANFFDLTSEHLPDVDVVYDRAACIALPVDTRKKYFSHLSTIIVKRPAIHFLITLEHTGPKDLGPPFPVLFEEINSLPYKKCEEICSTSEQVRSEYLLQNGVKECISKGYFLHF
ncbi:hypothetical protein OAB57_02840 [Bacteriovoracaceae bacterium]|nr:hypothetical protein [Bacteriovoracaceae bacterium]